MKMTQQHLDALVELENARCNGNADCKVPHTLIQEIESVIESLVRSGDTPGVPVPVSEIEEVMAGVEGIWIREDETAVMMMRRWLGIAP